MAATNTDAAFGFRPVNNLGPGDPGVNEYAISATYAVAMYVGDGVTLPAAGGSDSDGIPYVLQATVGGKMIGVVVGFDADATDLSLQYRKASTARKCWVVDDPDALFSIQEDSDGGAMTASDVGDNFDIILTVSGSKYTGQSGMEIDSSTGTAASGQLRVLRLERAPDNAIGTNARWIVKINEHWLTGTVGTTT